MRLVVGPGEMRVSGQPDDELVTYGLGSCLGVAAHDPLASVGGLAHVMLPVAGRDPARAARQPLLFVDSGLPRLLEGCCAAGADRRRLVVTVAGGGWPAPSGAEDLFRIGRRNVIMLRWLLRRNGLRLRGHDVGGRVARTMSLAVGTGEVTVRADGVARRL